MLRSLPCCLRRVLLAAFPARALAGQLSLLHDILKAALRNAPQALAGIVRKRLTQKGIDAAQKVYWLAAATLLDPERYESALWRHVGHSEATKRSPVELPGGQLPTRRFDWPLSAKTIGKLIEHLAPHAVIERPHGVHSVSDAMERGDHVRMLITQLATLASLKPMMS